MKVLSQKQIKVTSKTYELIKKPKAKNQNSGRVSITRGELDILTVNDKIKLTVLNLEDEEVATRTMTYSDLMSRLYMPHDSNYGVLTY